MIRSSLLLLLSSFSYVSLALEQIEFSASTPKNKIVDFIPHTEDKKFGSYLAMNLEAEPFVNLKSYIEKKLKLPLKSRGEAHITVITPPEFDNVLKKHLSIQKISDLAKQMEIQKSDLKYICVGQGLLTKETKAQKTFYVVIESQKLLKIREAIHQEYVKNGGNSADFQWNHFYPHITVGFTDRDLHEEDGVIKDQKSCLFDLPIKKSSKKN